MGIIDLIGALLSILAAITPTLVAYYVEEKQNAKDMRNRTLAELHAIPDRVPGNTSMQP